MESQPWGGAFAYEAGGCAGEGAGAPRPYASCASARSHAW